MHGIPSAVKRRIISKPQFSSWAAVVYSALNEISTMAIQPFCSSGASTSFPRDFIRAEGVLVAVSRLPRLHSVAEVLIDVIVAAIESIIFSHFAHVPASCVTL